MKKIKLISSIVMVLVVVSLYFGSVLSAQANSSRISNYPSCTTSGTSATTSISYMTAGTATTTLTCNLENMAGNIAGANAVDTSVMGVIFHASGTQSTLAWKYEYSFDGIDWFQDDVTNNSSATSTVHVRTFAENTWLFASSTIGATIAPLATSTKLVSVPTPLKYVRVVFYLPPGSLNAGVWAGIFGKTQIK